jgi:putative ABC transport system ATP-binding protein
LELIRRVAVQNDRAVIVVTHDSRIFSYGDRIVSMADGRVESVTAQTAGSPAQGERDAHG